MLNKLTCTLPFVQAKQGLCQLGLPSCCWREKKHTGTKVMAWTEKCPQDMWCDEIWFMTSYILVLTRTGCVQEPGNGTLLRNSAPHCSATALTHDRLPLKGPGKDSVRHMARCWCMLGTWQSLQEHETGTTGGPLVQSSRWEEPCECPRHDARAWVVETEPCYPQSSLLCHLFDLRFTEVLLWMSEEGTQRFIVGTVAL